MHNDNATIQRAHTGYTALGERWIPPLGPERPDGPREPPAFDDALDDEPDGPEGDESGRAPAGSQGGAAATIAPHRRSPTRLGMTRSLRTPGPTGLGHMTLDAGGKDTFLRPVSSTV